MDLAVEKGAKGFEFKVKDMSQAYFGRLEIKFAEVEMHGLMSCRTKFGPSQSLKGARITGSLHMTIQKIVLIETLTALGVENFQEYGWCTERALDWGPGGGPDLIVDDGGDATFFIHEGVKAKEAYAKDGTLPDLTSSDNPEFQIILSILCDATMEGLLVLTLEDVVETADIFITTIGNKDIIMVSRMRRMKNNAVVCNIGHFNNEIDMLGLETYLGIKKITIKP
ncbi:hypothetical protein L7F22_033723 [Adiantum nelumboides]|nr:hypothetical protein [Adiantum nelumboides]